MRSTQTVLRAVERERTVAPLKKKSRKPTNDGVADASNGVEVGDDEAEDREDRVSLPAAVSLTGTDWTTETIISQLDKKNILLSPRFQRRDAWDMVRKSRFIESLIVGLPIPQIVLAESKKDKNKFIVLDGKQRLLAITQFWGSGSGPNNSFALKEVSILTKLNGLTFAELKKAPNLEPYYNGLLNCPIRTVVLRSWDDMAFLHLVFLRLNTGSLPLSPQELRQAAFPGPFTDFADDFSSASEELRRVLGIKGPDYRMRDIELFARYVAFSTFLENYGGRMKRFLDETFEQLNADWTQQEARVKSIAGEFTATITALTKIFEDSGVARKPGARQLNRALFDALAVALADKNVRSKAVKKRAAVRKAFQALFKKKSFLAAVERATADVPSTVTRLTEVSAAIGQVTGMNLPTYKLMETKEGQRIRKV